MSNETDLDWLARNVHEWPAGAAFVRIHTNGNEPVFVTESGSACGCRVFTHSQWLARRADLRNKPSWADAPEWANWLGQTSRGSWEWYQGVQAPDHRDDGCFSYQQLGESSGKYGEVLGDWRDTLERRPRDLSEPAVTDRFTEATKNVLAASTELKSDRFKFEPLTSIEDNQEQVMQQKEEGKQQDNSWFERGELPPVGAECEFMHPGFGWVGCDIVGHYRLRAVCAPDGGGFYGGVADEFHPIRTEREKAIEEMKSHCPYPGSWKSTYLEFASVLYDAGYRKESK